MKMTKIRQPSQLFVTSLSCGLYLNFFTGIPRFFLSEPSLSVGDGPAGLHHVIPLRGSHSESRDAPPEFWGLLSRPGDSGSYLPLPSESQVLPTPWHVRVLATQADKENPSLISLSDHRIMSPVDDGHRWSP
eukprot:3940029-Rhodomonas_salina.2